MDCYNYPDSSSSSPRSRDIEPSDSSFFDDSAAQQLPPSSNYKLKFMVSYGGKIQPRLHDNHLTYLGGETKLLTVDRHISLPSLLSRLSSLSPDFPNLVSSFKYQLPGEDLDSLISVSSEDDLLHLFLEYDRLLRSSTSSKPPRMRLFLFPSSSSSSAQQPPVQSPECDRFIDALNSVPSATQDPLKDDPRSGRGGGGGANSVDFLLGFEKGMLEAGFRQDPVQSEREVAADRGMDPIEVQRQLQRMQLRGDGQDSVTYGRKIEESMNVVGGIGGYGLPADFYAPKIAEKTAPPTAPLQQAMQAPAAALAGYWQEKQAASVGFLATGVPEQQMYVIPGHPAGGIYHPAPPQSQMVRPVVGGSSHGYYAMPQRLPPEIYREHQPPPPQQQQQMYSIHPQQALSVGQPPSIQSQPQFSKAGEAVGMVRTSATGGGVVDAMNYRQVMYAATAGGGMMVPSPYQGMAAADTRLSGGLIQEGKVVGKFTQNSI